ncbi:hypothetical protein ANCCAN_23907 [Ancylostoma caninum]|uniref:Uncharacterized protein n=1 Tax=Ancylostoma caninum TaxID=29170 RepID=A0A368FDR0_ANCCA|nr:hypothetical protein ANCCAN_23907 [Ancylostoma caninum]
MVDIGSYAQEVAVGTKLAREYASEVNARMRKRMKVYYDSRKRVSTNPMKIGDRVYMRIPTEKQTSTYPKLTNPILIGIEHPMHLRRQCECGLFGQMAHVAIPALKHPLARSKKVQDMFQLANVPSISEMECWGDGRKEDELRKKNSFHLTAYGVALAIDAHRRRCHEYAKAVEEAKEKRYEHSAVFSWKIQLDVGECLTTALAMLDRIELPGSVKSVGQNVLIALPSAFSRVDQEIDYDESITMYVYADWSTLAQKFLPIPLITSIIVVWPDRMPESRAMRQTLIGLKRYLQCGGALAFFPSPYEDSNEAGWKKMGEVCSEFANYLTGLTRNFEAIVRDHYSDVLEKAPYTHPALCLGADPRFKRSPFVGRQILLFLEKLRLTVDDLIKLRPFDFASLELKERRRKEKIARAKRRCEERMPNFYVIEDPNRRRHQRNISFRKRECRRGTPPRFRRQWPEADPKNQDQERNQGRKKDGRPSTTHMRNIQHKERRRSRDDSPCRRGM